MLRNTEHLTYENSTPCTPIHTFLLQHTSPDLSSHQKLLEISTPQIGPPPLPIHRSLHINDILQPLPHLHNPTPNHPRINCYCFPHELLHRGRGIEPHYEVVSAVVAHLVLFGGFGEEEGAPVCYAADYATLGEDKIACCAGDSRRGGDVSSACLEIEQFQWRGVGTLFDFVGVVWSAYPNLANREY